jgi:hypothetical protein
MALARGGVKDVALGIVVSIAAFGPGKRRG